ncbi:DciA family protein [Maricaulis sp. CAU 1757]
MKRKPPPSTLDSAAARFLDSRRGRPAIRPAPSVSRAAERVLKPLAKRFGVGVEQLRENWPEIVGSRLAEWSEPETLQTSGGITTLVIRARGPAGAVLQAESRRLLDRMSSYCGRQAPSRIRIIQGSSKAKAGPAGKAGARQMTKPQASSQVSETVETSPETRLLSALDRFGQSVKSRTGH